MIKKLSLLLTLLGLAIASKAATLSVTVPIGGITNIWAANARVTQVIVAAPTTTNTGVLFIDSPTNQLTFVQNAFTNTVSYATNVVTTYTNFWGTVQNITNLDALVDITNNVVAASTNLYPQRISLSALANTTYLADNVNYYFINGVTITNTSSGTANVTITYFQQ
jgi:hypothetical protein